MVFSEATSRACSEAWPPVFRSIIWFAESHLAALPYSFLRVLEPWRSAPVVWRGYPALARPKPGTEVSRHRAMTSARQGARHQPKRKITDPDSRVIEDS